MFPNLLTPLWDHQVREIVVPSFITLPTQAHIVPSAVVRILPPIFLTGFEKSQPHMGEVS